MNQKQNGENTRRFLSLRHYR